ncbi:DUF2752 domain-containing protein [bacterium]|nr:DUF2752 domain-containing protein [candidate division CSSED10-310 bacterium]
MRGRYLVIRRLPYGEVVATHLIWFTGALMVVLVPLMLRLTGRDLVPCTMLRWTGYPCPFCGFTRALGDIMTGQGGAAWRDCPLAWPLFIAAVVLTIWHGCALVSGRQLVTPSFARLTARRARLLIAAAAVALLLNWVYRLLMGFA